MEPVQVEIYGQVYSMKGTDDPAVIRELAAFVDAKMKEVEKGTGTSDPHRVSILASLTIADELYRLRAQFRELGVAVDNATQRLLKLTDSSGQGGE